MSAPPKTRLYAAPEEAGAIRAAVIAADPSGLGADCTAASEKDAQALTHLLADPSIATAIYDLPSPITLQTVGAWIADAETKRRRGEALLTIRTATDGTIYSYSYFTIWPDLAAAEIAGAFAPSAKALASARLAHCVASLGCSRRSKSASSV